MSCSHTSALNYALQKNFQWQKSEDRKDDGFIYHWILKFKLVRAEQHTFENAHINFSF